MLKYLFKRLGVSIATLLVIISISFFMIRIAPGGPFASTRKAPPEVVVNLNKVYHLDEPLYEQFGRYLWGAAHLDFGPSFKYRDYTVWELISRGFPVSLRLGLWGLFFAIIGGVLLGTWAAVRQNSVVDYAAMTVGMVGVAIPSYIMAACYQMFFGILLGWLPVGGWDGSWSHMVLPVLVMALPGIADIARLTRGSMIDSLRSNHVRTARAKGMGQWLTVFRHALIGGLMPLIAYLGPATAGIVTGSVVVERAFSIPGIGRYFVEAASNRDYTMVMGTVIFYGMLIILANLAVDLIYALVDPKVRYE